MYKEDIYKYFTLKDELHATVREFVQESVKDTSYKDYPFSIDKIGNLGGGVIGIKVDFQVPPCNDYIEKEYKINVEELENY